jgi:arginine exporter protein ArgO
VLAIRKKIWLEVSVRCYIKANSVSMLQYEKKKRKKKRKEEREEEEEEEEKEQRTKKKKEDFYLIITILEPHLIPNEITTSKKIDP